MNEIPRSRRPKFLSIRNICLFGGPSRYVTLAQADLGILDLDLTSIRAKLGLSLPTLVNKTGSGFGSA